MSRLQLNMHISKHSYCLANGYKLNKNYTEVLYSLWDACVDLVLGIHIGYFLTFSA